MNDNERQKQVDDRIDNYLDSFNVRNGLQPSSTGQSSTGTTQTIQEKKPNLFIRLCHTMTEAFDIIFRKLYRTIKSCLSVFKSIK